MVEGNKELEVAGFPVKRGMTGGGNGRFTFPCHGMWIPGINPRMTEREGARMTGKSEESLDSSVVKTPSE